MRWPTIDNWGPSALSGALAGRTEPTAWQLVQPNPSEVVNRAPALVRVELARDELASLPLPWSW